ncbi:MAG: bifunctional diaminohydroxyphosphoribosylaminopyrimidine deaminase/5-amino-6-(5-phosphoribosylamino)uracil reductase RibD [Tannerella sp.]|uniref:bifunctional diaminohydroxyphosphoribosylaminopyrimidine deaminase/5-amino-6-(5-phosphoribosylamino)uracil reductase RibD n=1 Tax=Tannerella sp. TaxID=2382127 RepID=UPI003FA2FE57
MDTDEKYMARCLTLAAAGAGMVSPNPMVGAVVVHRGHIIGEGYHRQFGGAHAEVHAIASVRDETLLRDSTLYVSLEPCSHHGKTLPCTELIIRKRIPRVVIACIDPFPAVSGRGVQKLKEAGIDVKTGVLEKEALYLNRFFMTAQTHRRPYIILKWAQSADGFLDRIRTDASMPAVRLSCATTVRMVHKLRSEVDAIMVGTRTVYLDNPSLTVRHWAGKHPVRVLSDRSLRVPTSATLFDGTIRTLVYNAKKSGVEGQTEYLPLDLTIPIIPQILQSLHEKRIQSLLVEGGALLHRRFMESGLWDEARIETTPAVLGSGVKAADIRTANDAVWEGEQPIRSGRDAGHTLATFMHKHF